MKFNDDEKLFLTDIYHYDISACHYNLIKQLNLIPNIDDILDKDDKLNRNITIGKLMNEKPNLYSTLKNHTYGIIESYIIQNGLTTNDILLHQYDGLLLKKKLKINTDFGLNLELQNIFNKFIISYDRSSYIAINSKDEIFIKGISNYYDGLKPYYKNILDINFLNKTSIFNRLYEIRNNFLTSEDLNIFTIPIKNNNDKVIIYLKEQYGTTAEINKSIIKLIDPMQIDTYKYYKLYLQDFISSIVKEFI